MFYQFLSRLWYARLPRPRLAGRSALLVRLDISIVLTAVRMPQGTRSFRVFSSSSLPKVAKVPGITGWDLFNYGVYVGVAFNNNADVSGLAFTDIALWMSAASPVDVALA